MGRKDPAFCCDVDDTIYASQPRYVEALSELGKNPPLPEEVDSWDFYPRTYGPEIAHEMFARALDPKKVGERELYPGVVEALGEIKETMGVRIVFITHNHDPDAMSPYLTPWLKENFGSDVGVCVLHSHESKLDVMKAVGAVAMVDDRADFISAVGREGMFAAAKIQSHNKNRVVSDHNVYAFHEWSLVPGEFDFSIHRKRRMMW